MNKRIPPPHPGETIKEEYLVPLGMSVNTLAKALGRRSTIRPRPSIKQALLSRSK